MGWMILPDHQHLTIEPGKKAQISLTYAFTGRHEALAKTPKLSLATDYLDEGSRIALPERWITMQVDLAPVPDTFFLHTEQRVLDLGGDNSALRVRSDSFELPDGPFTLECWANPDKELSNGALVAKTESSEFGILIRDGVARFEVFLGESYKRAEATTKLAVDKWSHVAGVFDGENLSLYIDGSRVGHVEAEGKRKTNSKPLYIGADPDGRGAATRSFSGQIDNVRLSSVARYAGGAFETDGGEVSPDPDTVLLFDCNRSVGVFVPGRAAGRNVSGRMVGKLANLVDGNVE